MKYRVTQPFLAFGKAPEAGEVVELTEEQAALLANNDCITPYETKVQPLPDNKAKKKPTPSASVRPARVSKKKTAKRSKKSAKK